MAKTVTANLVETLLEMAKACCTGVIRFENAATKKQLVLREGLVVFAESNSQEEHLARILLKMNLLKRAQLSEIASLMKKGKPTDEAIIACSKLDVAALQSGAREQAVTILASVMAWGKEAIHFYPGDGLIRRQIDLRLPLLELLVMAARRAVSDCLAPNFNGQPQGLLSRAVEAHADLLRLPLSPPEAFALSLIQEKTPVEGLLPLLPSTEAKPAELIQRLILLGLVRLEVHGADSVESAHVDSPADDLTSRLQEMLAKFEVANLYEILTVAPDAKDADIKQAYHELARQYHPDRFQSEKHSPETRSLVEKVFTYVTGAYSILGDVAARAVYDDTRLQKESQVEATLQARAATDAEKEKMAETIFRAGRLSLQEAEFEKAVGELKECVWLLPHVSRHQHFLGVAQTEIPRLRKEAEQHLLRALQLDKTSVESRLALARLYIKAALPRRAESQLNEVLGLDRDNSEALRLLGEIAGDTSRASGSRLQTTAKR
ncbi:MAG TPA: DnaJ domain-containing protein [Acidobacteriota bacterium]|nr:DnaJ domain-containing protein [Acidobacteriota bacterium]